MTQIPSLVQIPSLTYQCWRICRNLSLNSCPLGNSYNAELHDAVPCLRILDRSLPEHPEGQSIAVLSTFLLPLDKKSTCEGLHVRAGWGMSSQICFVRKGLSCALSCGPGSYKLLYTAVEPPQVTIAESRSQPLHIFSFY